jgi:hypothetical protein
MSQYIGVVSGARVEYVADQLRTTRLKEEALRFGTSDEARDAAAAIQRLAIDQPGFPRLYPWIVDVGAERASEDPQYIGVVKGGSQQAFVAEGARITESRDDAQRFEGCADAKLAAASLIGSKTLIEPDDWRETYPWITDVDCEEIE